MSPSQEPSQNSSITSPNEHLLQSISRHVVPPTLGDLINKMVFNACIEGQKSGSTFHALGGSNELRLFFRLWGGDLQATPSTLFTMLSSAILSFLPSTTLIPSFLASGHDAQTR